MKIPENFKQKYQLKGESYPSANADAALSELFAVSGRLYKENADLKAEVAALREAAENAAPASVSAEVDLSGVEALIASLSDQIASIKTAVNDTLCVVNDAAISAKKAEEAAAEAKTASEAAKNAAEDALGAAAQAAGAVKEIKETAEAAKAAGDSASENAKAAKDSAQTILDAIDALGDKIEGVPSDVLPLIFSEDMEAGDEGEIVGIISDPIVPFPEISSIRLAEEEEAAEAEKEEILIPEVAAVEEVEDEPAEEVPAAPEAEEQIPEEIPTEDIVEEPVEEIAEEPVEEIEDDAEEATEKEEASDIADDLIRSAGLDSEPEDIEPAAPIDESDLTARLAKMYAETEDEELPIVNREEEKEEAQPETEKHAPTSFTDMKSALDAIRARLKK